MTPIETTYGGVTFRSRLEARWAVFFDKLGVRWLYEPEGFELPSGARYLPDFYLSDLKIWVEIKPEEVDLDTGRRLLEFAQHLSPEQQFALFIAPPLTYKPSHQTLEGAAWCALDPDWAPEPLTCVLGILRERHGVRHITDLGEQLGYDEVCRAAKAANAYRFW